MIKDIFIDASIANKFAGTAETAYKQLIQWLLLNIEGNKEGSAHLIVSKSLRNEYFGGNCNCTSPISIQNIYGALQKQDRIILKETHEIKTFMDRFFKDDIWKKNISCKRKGSHDPEHIALILLSNRRVAIIEDVRFLHDVLNFPLKRIKGKKIRASSTPENLNYADDEAA